MDILEQAQRFVKTLDSVKYALKNDINLESKTQEEIGKIVYIFEPFKMDKDYSKNDLVEHHAKLYKALKNHKSNYQNMPNLDKDCWQIVGKDGQSVEPTVLNPYYSHDQTYDIGDKVVYYGKNYESLAKQSGVSPADNPNTWKAI